jgi:hypothetical protein
VSTDDVLAAPPRLPADLDLFSSNPLFGEPGIYPDGTPMAPAVGPPLDEVAALAALARLGVDDAVPAHFAAPELVRRVPDPGPRAGLVALATTVAEALVHAFLAGEIAVARIEVGPTASPGRIVGPGATTEPGTRVVNDRYQAEHPALLAGSLAHDLLWSGPGAGQYEEATLHALCALVHTQLLARAPFLAHTGTELARRQNSLAISLLNSRHPGSPDISIVAADGPGTIPGGAPGMQTPDFWSIPFVAGPPQPSDAPPALAAVLAAVVGSAHAVPTPLRYDDDLGRWLSRVGVRGALSRDDQLRAAVALGLVDGPDREGGAG